MTDLIYAEKDLVQSLKAYIQEEESKLLKIKSWAEKMESLTVKSTSDPEGYLAHPVNAYKLVKRLNTEWLELENLVLQDSTKGFITNLTIQRQFFPNEEDETGAAKALMRLQDTYKLDPETISKGEFPGFLGLSGFARILWFDIDFVVLALPHWPWVLLSFHEITLVRLGWK
ncbi:UNVERIFIED_CONTAM: Prolyl 4-hydroxylase, alpha polypeptide [Gekko kuhli]